MTEVDVKKSSGQSSHGNQALERQGRGRDISRGRGWDPFAFSLSPTDFFSSNPFSLMRRMSEEMDRAFSQFFGGAGGERTSTWYPAIEVSEQNGQLQVHADLPGIKPEDVKVEVTDGSLVLRGERKSEHEHRVGGAYRSERHYGQFYREIALPEGANPEQAKAQFHDGVLEVTLPVPQQASNRREIPIQSGQSSSSAAAGAGTSTQTQKK